MQMQMRSQMHEAHTDSPQPAQPQPQPQAHPQAHPRPQDGAHPLAQAAHAPAPPATDSASGPSGPPGPLIGGSRACPASSAATSRPNPGAPGDPGELSKHSQPDRPNHLGHLGHLDQQLNLDVDLKLENLTLESQTTWQHSQSSSSSHSAFNTYTYHQATRQALHSLQYSEHAQSVLNLSPDACHPRGHPYQSHTRSQSHAELPLNPISIQPSLPPSLTTTPDSPIARSVPLPSVEDVFTSRPCSPWRSEFSSGPDTEGNDADATDPTRNPSSSGHEHCCEPVYRNRLLDMVRDEFGMALDFDDGVSVASGSTHGLELDGMSRTASRSVSRSNTIRSARSAVSRASTSRGISPQPTIVLSLEGSDEEMLHEGTEEPETNATGAQRPFRPLTTCSGGESDASDSTEGRSNLNQAVGDGEEALTAAEAQQTQVPEGEACAHAPQVMSLAALRALQLPAAWPRVSLVSPEKLVIDRRVVSSGVPVPEPSEPSEFGGMVPLDIPEFQLGDAAIDLSAPLGSSVGSSLGSSVGSGMSVCSRISRDRKGSNETAITYASSASAASGTQSACPSQVCLNTAGSAAGNAGASQLFGRDFAARLILEMYRASLLKSPIASPMNSPSTSPSTGTATAWWGGGLSVRAASREVLRDDDTGRSEASFSHQSQAQALPQDTNGDAHGGLGLGLEDADDGVQEVIMPDSDSGSNCSTPIAATAPRGRPTITPSGFKLEGKAFEFDPPFSAADSELLARELLELINQEGVEQPFLFNVSSQHSPYASHYSPNGYESHGKYAPCDLSARLADPRAASLGPLAPELATTRPSTPPDTPTVGCAPLPTLTAPVTPIQTRPSSPTVLQKAVAINAALQQLARNGTSTPASGSDSPRGAPMSPLSIGSGASTSNERSSRVDDLRRQSLRAAGVISPSSTGSPSSSSGSRRKSLDWAKMTPRTSGEYAKDIFGGLLRDSGPNASVSQPSSPEFLKRKVAGEWDLSTTESAPGSPKSSRRATLSGLGLFLTRARAKQK